MNGYLYETHLHTSQASACGRSRGREYVKQYRDLGYTGIIVTDHFYRGNSALDRDLPWAKWVNAFCRGYEDAREEGARRGLDVFFGWEETYDGDDYLVYGLDKEWLLQHPEVRFWTRKEQYEAVRRCGGCVVHAHPFRQRDYLAGINLSGYMDAVEVANSGNQRSFDALAWAYAQKIKVPATAGSDIHLAADIRDEVVFGVYLQKKMETIGDYVHAVRNNAITGLKIPAGRCDPQGDEKILLPVNIRDSRDQRIGKDIAEFLGW
jgi:hypothetical protein